MSRQMSMVSDPSYEWGGPWTEKKLDAFSKYVSAYLIIMAKQPHWKTIYFDGFAGCGNRKEHCNTPLYQQLFLTSEEERVYKGAAERVLTLPNNLSFDYHYFVDLKTEHLEKLKEKLSSLQKTKKTPFQYRDGDANKWLIELSKALKAKKSLAALVLLDPFGMQINWDSIASFKNTRSDVWILIPTGVIVNRLLDKECKLKSLNKLQSFFGLNEEEIKSYFYRVKTYQTLFGETEIVRKISNPIENIAVLYSERLKTVWNHVTEKPLRLENSRGVPIFHFVFASNNQNAVKIAKQIIKTI